MDLKHIIGMLAFVIFFTAGIIACVASKFDDSSPISWAGVSSMAISVLFLVLNISPMMTYIESLL